MNHIYQDEIEKLARDITGLIKNRGVSDSAVIYVYNDLRKKLNGSKPRLDTLIFLYSQAAGLNGEKTLNDLRDGCEELERQRRFLGNEIGKAVEKDITRCFKRFEERAAAAC